MSLRNKLTMIKFWMIAFLYIIWNVHKNNKWHMIYVDFHLGDKPDGRPIRRQLIARKNSDGLSLDWQQLSEPGEKFNVTT